MSAQHGVLRVAVTGAGGLIGRRLTRDLGRDYTVMPIRRSSADLLNLQSLIAAFRGCDAVVHLAAGVLREGTWDEVWEPNIAGVRNMFEAALQTGCRRVIYASSLHVMGMYEEEGRPAIYAPHQADRLSTSTPVRPGNPYAVTKVFGEILARYYSDVHQLPVACVRIGTMNEADSPHDPALHESARLKNLSLEERYARLASKWFSHADFARLVRAILSSDVPFAIVYGVGDNAGRFVELEPGRTLFGFWPLDRAEDPNRPADRSR